MAPGRDTKVIDTTKSMFSLSVNVNYLVARFGGEFGTKSGGKSIIPVFTTAPKH